MYEAEKGLHITNAATKAIMFFGAQRKARWREAPRMPAAVEVFRFGDTDIIVQPTDYKGEQLADRWFSENEAKREFRQRVIEANPELEELMPRMGLAAHLSMGNTLDWIVKFAAIADDSVVELFGKEVAECFERNGYKPQEPMTFGEMMKDREAARTNRDAYGRHIVGLFLFELAKGREITRNFASAVKHYDEMPYAQA